MSVFKKTVVLCVLTAAVAMAQGQEKVFPPSADQKAEIHKKLAELSARIAALGDKTDPALLADVRIYQKGVDYILRFPDEFFGENYVADTITALDTGIGRSIELENGTSSWTRKTGNVVRGFVSRIDGSVTALRPDDSRLLRRQEADAPRCVAARHAGADERSSIHAAAGGAARDIADSGR